MLHLLLFFLSTQTPTTSSTSTSTSLPTRIWNTTETPDADFIRNITEDKRPQHIRNSPVSKQWKIQEWGAKPWSFDILADEFKLNVSTCTQNNVRLMRACCEERVKTIKQFFVDSIQQDKYKHKYDAKARERFHISIDYENFPSPYKERITKGMTPTDLLFVPDPPGLTLYTRNIRGHSIDLLFSSIGIILPFEFSEMHTFYFQMQGRVRAKIYPPLWHQLYLFPKFHLRSRYSQLFGDDSNVPFNSSLFPLFSPDLESKEMRIAILDTGDVLYVPPFHFVELESQWAATTIVKVSSPSYQIEKLHRIWNVDIPIHPADTDAKKIFDGANLISLVLIKTLFTGDGGKAFMPYFIESRFSNIFANAKKQKGDPATAMVSKFHAKNSAAERWMGRTIIDENGQLNGDNVNTSFMNVADIVEACRDEDMTHSVLIVKAAEVIAEFVKDFTRSKWFDQRAMEIVLGNWIEDVTHSLVGMKRMELFLNACFGGDDGVVGGNRLIVKTSEETNPPPVEIPNDQVKTSRDDL
jgi:hypothetical protein